MADSSAQPKISVMQQRFIDAYCTTARFNASEAARLAGYSEKTAGQKGFELKNIETIRARINEYLANNTLSAPEVLHELTDVGMRGLGEFIEITKWNQDGEPVSARMDASAKMKALELLGKHHALFTENLNLGGGVQIDIVGVDVDKI